MNGLTIILLGVLIFMLIDKRHEIGKDLEKTDFKNKATEGFGNILVLIITNPAVLFIFLALAFGYFIHLSS